MIISPFSEVKFVDNLLADATTSLTKLFQMVIAASIITYMLIQAGDDEESIKTILCGHQHTNPLYLQLSWIILLP